MKWYRGYINKLKHHGRERIFTIFPVFMLRRNRNTYTFAYIFKNKQGNRKTKMVVTYRKNKQVEEYRNQSKTSVSGPHKHNLDFERI